MPDDFANIKMVGAKLIDLHIASGDEGDVDGIEVSLSFDSARIVVDGRPVGLDLKATVESFPEDSYYSIQAIGRTLFSFPDEMDDGVRDRYLKTAGATRARDAICQALESITGHFISGAMQIPGETIDLSDVEWNE